MKRNRQLFGLVLLGMFLAYFSASFIFVPKAAPLKDTDTSIVKLETNDGNVAQGLFRSSTEHSEDTVKLLGDYTISFIENCHTVLQQSRLESLQNAGIHNCDIYLSLRRLQI